MNHVAQLEQQLTDAKAVISIRQMALRLYQNADFKTLIIDGFCSKDAARLVQESGDPVLSAEQRADALSMAQASGHLKRFLSMCVQMGAASERTLDELEDALEEARQEEGA